MSRADDRIKSRHDQPHDAVVTRPRDAMFFSVARIHGHPTVPLAFPMRVPNLGRPIMTGGVVFLSGTLDYFVRAYDVSNGQRLWQAQLPMGG